MSVIKINTFGGELPSASARSIPAGSARSAKNILASINEFRPLNNDLEITGIEGAAGAKTIYKLLNTAVNSGWITNQLRANYVRGQIDDDTTERTYYTQSTGAPRVRDNTRTDRQLGVPAPGRPQVTTTVTVAYTTADADKAKVFTTNEFKTAIGLAATSILVGNTPAGGPSAAGAGWLPHGAVTTPPLPTTKAGDWAYLTPMHVVSDVMTLVYPEHAELQDQALFGVAVVYGGTTYWAVSVAMQARGYSVDAASLKINLLAIANPANTSAALLSDAEAQDAATQVANGFSAGSSTLAPLIGGINAAQAKVLAAAADASSALVSHVDVSALVAAIATLKAATDKVELAYADLVANLITVIDGEYLSGMILPRLPDAEANRIIDARFYVTTFVTDWGEESAPSLVSYLQLVDQDDACVITCAAQPENRSIVGWRLYRSNSGSTTSAFQLVNDEQATNAVLSSTGAFDYFLISQRTYTDTQRSAELGEVLPTLTWLEPPADLKGLTGMANGVMAGFFGNCVCFCEPYIPYAWPIEYQITLKHQVVGLGSFGQTLFVGTSGTPYLISGSDSASMSAVEAGDSQACASARSIASVPGGVLYASPDGLCAVDASGVKLISGGLFTRADWQALNPSTMLAESHDGVYYLFHDAGCFALHLATGKLIKLDLTGVTAVHTDKRSDTLYVATGSGLFALFRGTGSRIGVYRTGIVQTPKYESFAWLQVDSDFSAPVTVKWYGDDSTTAKHTATVTSTQPVRLPAGRYREHEVEIQTASRVTSLTLASSTAELRSV